MASRSKDTTVLLVDNHSAVLEKLASHLPEGMTHKLALTVAEAIHITKASEPLHGLATVLRFRAGSGTDIIDAWNAKRAGVPVLVMGSRYDKPKITNRACRTSRHFLAKPFDREDFRSFTSAVLAERWQVYAPVAEPFVAFIWQHDLAVGQAELLSMVGRNLSLPRMAEEMGISTETLRTRMGQLCQRLHVTSVDQAYKKMLATLLESDPDVTGGGGDVTGVRVLQDRPADKASGVSVGESISLPPPAQLQIRNPPMGDEPDISDFPAAHRARVIALPHRALRKKLIGSAMKAGVSEAEAEDLFQAAFVKLVKSAVGDWDYVTDANAFYFLTDKMKGIWKAQLRKATRRRTDLDTEKTEEAPPSSDRSAVKGMMAREEAIWARSELLREVASNPLAVSVVHACMAEGQLTPAELAVRLGEDIRHVYVAQRRITRAIERIWRGMSAAKPALGRDAEEEAGE